MNQDLLAITTKGGYLIGKKGNIKSHCACASHAQNGRADEPDQRHRGKQAARADGQRRVEYIQNGNRRLLADAAIWDWYERAKRKVAPQNQEGGK